MKHSEESPENDFTITKIAAQMSAMELIIGTFFQSLHIPFTGHVLSLNQGFFLTQVTALSNSRWMAAKTCYEVSGVASVFKSFAPSARKLGPMLSLMMQGLFYSLGVLIFGRGILGQWVGFILLSTWAFLQPLVTLLISFGWSHSEKVLTFYGERIHQDYGFINPIIKWAILFVISVKFILATMVFLMNRWAIFKNIKLKQEQISEYALKKFVDQGGELPRSQNKKSGILKDLSQPLFLMSLVFTFVFLFVTQPKPSLMVWYLMRPIGIYLLISFCLRSPAFLQFLDQKTQSFKILRPIHERAQKLKIYLLQNK
jgi:hypothetical protein